MSVFGDGRISAISTHANPMSTPHAEQFHEQRISNET